MIKPSHSDLVIGVFTVDETGGLAAGFVSGFVLTKGICFHEWQSPKLVSALISPRETGFTAGEVERSLKLYRSHPTRSCCQWSLAHALLLLAMMRQTPMVSPSKLLKAQLLIARSTAQSKKAKKLAAAEKSANKENKSSASGQKRSVAIV